MQLTFRNSIIYYLHFAFLTQYVAWKWIYKKYCRHYIKLITAIQIKKEYNNPFFNITLIYYIAYYIFKALIFNKNFLKHAPMNELAVIVKTDTDKQN